MAVYLDLVILLNFMVDFLLLLGANRLSGCPSHTLRCILSAAVGGIYAGACMLPGTAFLGNTLCRTASLGAMAVLAFGWNLSALRRGILFVFLSMSLGGIAVGMGKSTVLSLLLSAVCVAVMCRIGFRGKIGSRSYVPVELMLGGQKYRLTALLDTGNTLTDPITGQQVLVVGADVAQRTMGLTARQLADPIATAGSGRIPGLRLIPYRAVGQSGGMLLAFCFDEVKIGGEPSGRLVAFAPEKIGSDGAYQALTGGVI